MMNVRQMMYRKWAERVGVNIPGLDVGTTMQIDTETADYDIQILANKNIMITGGEFEDATEVIYLGAEWPDEKYIKKGWLGKGMCMVLLHHNKKITTSKVLAARMTNSRFHLEIWE